MISINVTCKSAVLYTQYTKLCLKRDPIKGKKDVYDRCLKRDPIKGKKDAYDRKTDCALNKYMYILIYLNKKIIIKPIIVPSR